MGRNKVEVRTYFGICVSTVHVNWRDRDVVMASGSKVEDVSESASFCMFKWKRQMESLPRLVMAGLLQKLAVSHLHTDRRTDRQTDRQTDTVFETL
jgi:hypothetical protein